MRRKGRKLNKQEKKIEEHRKVLRRMKKHKIRQQRKEIIETLLEEIDDPPDPVYVPHEKTHTKSIRNLAKARKRKARKK